MTQRDLEKLAENCISVARYESGKITEVRRNEAGKLRVYTCDNVKGKKNA